MNSELKLTSIGISYLDQARKWTYFLSIIGFIFTGIVVIAALFLSSLITKFSGMDSSYGVSGFTAMGTGTIIYLVLAVIYFSLSLFLYRFSTRIKAAVHEHNSAQLEDGLKNLKSYWKLTGILTAVVLSLYVLVFVFSIIYGAAAFAGL